MLSIRWAVSAISFHVECGHNFNLQVDVAAVQVYTFQDYSSKHQQHVSFNGVSNTPATTYIFHTVSSSNKELIKYTTKCTSKTQQSQLIFQVQGIRSSIYTVVFVMNNIQSKALLYNQEVKCSMYTPAIIKKFHTPSSIYTQRIYTIQHIYISVSIYIFFNLSVSLQFYISQ